MSENQGLRQFPKTSPDNQEDDYHEVDDRSYALEEKSGAKRKKSSWSKRDSNASGKKINVTANLSKTLAISSIKTQNYARDLEEDDAEETEGPGGQTSANPGYSKCLLILLFIFMTFQNFSSYYIFDFPQLFEHVLIDTFEIDALKVSYLYAIYSIPNFVAAPLISVLLNYTGFGFGAIMLSFLIAISAFLQFLACKFNLFWLMVVARAIFGVGGESLAIAQAAMAEEWFTGKFLTVAIGINNVVSLLGSGSAAFVGPQIYDSKRNIQWVLFVMGIVCFCSWLTSIGYWITEQKIRSQIKKKEESENLDGVTAQGMTQANGPNSEDDFSPDEFENLRRDKSTQQLIFSSDPREQKQVIFTYRHIKYLGKLFWLLAILFSFISMSQYQFTNFVTDLLMQRFKYDYIGAKNLVTLIPVTTIILIPIISAVVLTVGKKGIILTLSSMISFGVYTYMQYLPAEPSHKVTACIVLTALFFSLYSTTIWSSMTLVIPQQGTSVALGLATTIQNILMTALPILFGYINQPRTVKAYNTSLTILRALGIGAFISGIVVTIVDFRTGKRLHLPENDKKVMEAKSRATEEFRRTTNVFSLDSGDRRSMQFGSISSKPGNLAGEDDADMDQILTGKSK